MPKSLLEEQTRGIAPWVAEPYRLWSLYDMIRLLQVSDVFILGSALELQAGLPQEVNESTVSEEMRVRMLTVYPSLQNMCTLLGLHASAKTAGRIVALVDQGRPIAWGELTDHIEELRGRFEDEIDAGTFLAIDPASATLFVGVDLFGELVPQNFPSVVGDVEEAAKCLALSRGTASVFHLMRVLERALRALMKDMGEPYDPGKDSDWARMLAKCNQHVGTAGAKQDFYRDAVTMLTTVKWSWRNPTMHPKNVYTEEEARDVWSSVRIFMRHIATELHEGP